MHRHRMLTKETHYTTDDNVGDHVGNVGDSWKNLRQAWLSIGRHYPHCIIIVPENPA